jgi:hypothetical protein
VLAPLKVLAVLGGRLVTSPVELEPLAPGETAAIHLTLRGRRDRQDMAEAEAIYEGL